MTYRSKDSSSRDGYTQSKARFGQQSKNESTNEKGEGCPVVEGSGLICGETTSLSIINEFRKFYDECINKLENSAQGREILKKLTPLKNLINDLWEQNIMLVETVEELEQEAAAKVISLQDKLNKSCQKLRDCEDDIKCLVHIIQRIRDNCEIDLSAIKFKTLRWAFVFRESRSSYRSKRTPPKAASRKMGNSDIFTNRRISRPIRKKEYDPNDILSLCYMSCTSNSSIGNESPVELQDPRFELPVYNRRAYGGERISSLSRKTISIEAARELSKEDNNLDCTNETEITSINESNVNESKYDGCIGQINISLNIETDGNPETRNYCPCDCSFSVNTSTFNE